MQGVFVLIVEDHPLVADSLHACVRACDAELAIETAETLGAALLILARRSALTAPILITTDLSLPDASGSEAVRRLREAAPNCPLLVFSALDESTLRREASELGATDYLLKSASASILRSKIKSILGSQTYSVSDAPAVPSKAPHLLTAKQQTVMQELVAGRSNREIAGRMKVSPETVASHMKEIFSRLGVRNRTEAVVRYLDLLQSL